jgi:GT2 family glycosyltransferase
MEARIQAAAVVVSYKTSHLMADLISSIDEPHLDIDVYILDNGSTEATFSALQQIEGDGICLLRSSVNLGFTKGVNYVIRHIQETGKPYQYVFLINPDALSKKNLVYELVSLIKKHPMGAAVSPQIIDLKGNLWYAGGTIHLKKGSVVSHIDQLTKESQELREVDVFSGCAVVFDLGKLMKAGLFDEDLFMYFDEAELSIRLRKLGYKIMYSPLHVIKHDVSYTTKKISHLKTYYMTRNRFIVFNDDMSIPNKVYYLIYELLFHLKHRRFRNAFYHLLGYCHFLKGRSGSYKSA